MIESEDVLGMGFYKKGTFTGSYKGLRYRIARDDSDADAGERFLVTAWHGPYCFDATPDKEKTSSFFPFTADGKEDAVAWLNAQWETLPDDAR